MGRRIQKVSPVEEFVLVDAPVGGATVVVDGVPRQRLVAVGDVVRALIVRRLGVTHDYQLLQVTLFVRREMEMSNF